MKNLLKVKAPTKTVDFMGQKNSVTIRQLSSAEVLDFQAFAKSISEATDETAGLSIQFRLIRMAVEDAVDLTDDELKSFPFPEISALVEAILAYSGLDTKTEGNVSAKKN